MNISTALVRPLTLGMGLAVLVTLAIQPTEAAGPPLGSGTTIDRLPFEITACGVYTVDRCLRGMPGENGITVRADDVTIDLGGYVIGSDGQALSGIFVEGARSGFSVTNGTIRGFGGRGIAAGASLSARIEDVFAVGNGLEGIEVGPGAVVRRCRAAENGGDGIATGGAGTVTSCSVDGGGGDGIDVGPKSTVERCTVRGTALRGVRAGAGASVLECTVSNTGQMGISGGGGSMIVRCTVRDTASHGISGGDGGLVTGNLVTSNPSGAGVIVSLTTTGCRIVDNHSIGNMIGFDVLGTDNLVLRNSTAQNTGNDYIIFAGNAYGQVVDVDGADSFSSTDPWQNFTY